MSNTIKTQNKSKSLKVKTSLKAGGFTTNHNETFVRS